MTGWALGRAEGPSHRGDRAGAPSSRRRRPGVAGGPDGDGDKPQTGKIQATLVPVAKHYRVRVVPAPLAVPPPSGSKAGTTVAATASPHNKHVRQNGAASHPVSCAERPCRGSRPGRLAVTHSFERIYLSPLGFSRIKRNLSLAFDAPELGRIRDSITF